MNNRRERFLSYEEARQLLDALNKVSSQVHDQALISLHCGLRFGEIARLTWGDVDLDNEIIKVKDAKGDDRHAYITKPVKEALKRLNKVKHYKPNNFYQQAEREAETSVKHLLSDCRKAKS